MLLEIFVFLLFEQTYLRTTKPVLLIVLRKNPLTYQPTEKSLFELDKPTALLTYTVTQSLDFQIPRKHCLEKFTV